MELRSGPRRVMGVRFEASGPPAPFPRPRPSRRRTINNAPFAAPWHGWEPFILLPRWPSLVAGFLAQIKEERQEQGFASSLPPLPPLPKPPSCGPGRLTPSSRGLPRRPEGPVLSEAGRPWTVQESPEQGPWARGGHSSRGPGAFPNCRETAGLALPQPQEHDAWGPPDPGPAPAPLPRAGSAGEPRAEHQAHFSEPPWASRRLQPSEPRAFDSSISCGHFTPWTFSNSAASRRTPSAPGGWQGLTVTTVQPPGLGGFSKIRNARTEIELKVMGRLGDADQSGNQGNCIQMSRLSLPRFGASPTTKGSNYRADKKTSGEASFPFLKSKFVNVNTGEMLPVETPFPDSNMKRLCGTIGFSWKQSILFTNSIDPGVVSEHSVSPVPGPTPTPSG